MTDGFLLKQYDVLVNGFDAVTYYAASPAKARVQAWRAYCNAYDCSFKRFIQISTVRKSSRPAPKGFGAKILVGGKPAFRVQHDGQYVHFVRPGETTLMLSHPLDVRTL